MGLLAGTPTAPARAQGGAVGGATHLWARRLPTEPGFTVTPSASPAQVALDRRGNVYAAALISRSDSPVNGKSAGVFAYTPDGHLARTALYNAPGLDRVYGIVATPAGEVYIAAHSSERLTPSVTRNLAHVVKFGPDGAVRWSRTLDGVMNSRASCRAASRA